jgi:hypothetical protein
LIIKCHLLQQEFPCFGQTTLRPARQALCRTRQSVDSEREVRGQEAAMTLEPTST